MVSNGQTYDKSCCSFPASPDGHTDTRLYPDICSGKAAALLNTRHVSCAPRWTGVPTYLCLALRREVLLDEHRPQGHAEVLIGLCQTQPAQLELPLCAVDLTGELVDCAPEGGGQVLAERRHDAP